MERGGILAKLGMSEGAAALVLAFQNPHDFCCWEFVPIEVSDLLAVSGLLSGEPLGGRGGDFLVMFNAARSRAMKPYRFNCLAFCF